MNDEFLTQFHEVPRAEFADALYERISQQPQSRLARVMANKLTFRNVAAFFAIMFLVAACVYAVVEKRWNKVGGIWVDVQRTLKTDYNPEEPQLAPEPECLNVKEAREVLSFEFHVPTWAPDGFMFDDCVRSHEVTSEFAGLYWKGADEYSGISITLQNLRRFDMVAQEYRIGSAYTMVPVAPGSYEEVQVKGKPAVLVRGDWAEPWMTGPLYHDYEFKWDTKRGLQLIWVDGEVMYHLLTHADVSAKDLIEMAESAQ